MIFVTAMGVLPAVQAMAISNQEKLDNHTMKLVFNQYPANNQWLKLVNGKSARCVLLPCVKYLLAGDCFKEPLKY